MKLRDLIPGEPEARATLAAIGIAIGTVLLVLLVLGVRSCISSSAREDAAQSKVGEAVAQGTAGAAQDATAITGNTMDTMIDLDATQRSNEDAIRKSGGDGDAWLRMQCMRASNAHQPRCAGLLNNGAQAAH